MAARNTCEVFDNPQEASRQGTESDRLPPSLALPGRSHVTSGLFFTFATRSAELPQQATSPIAIHPTDGEAAPALTEGGSPEVSVEDRAMPPRQRLLFPEPEKNGLETALLPIARKQSLRAVARYKRGEPVMVRLDLIRAAYANSGLTHQDIGNLIGKSRYTVAAALRVDPSTSFYTFCEVMNVLGLELAELFPVRRKKARQLPERKPMKWSRGPHLKENARRLNYEARMSELMNKRHGGRRGK